ncbi:hypothetical protein [Streptomyces sp. NPDC020817]|uniref:hypothetical protein n=1 Tax=Streptomyces sp. NPDC020817 TaxID=3365095 RepID=UPI0037A47BEC
MSTINVNSDGPLSALLGVLIPKKRAHEPSVDWHAIEAVIDSRLPGDYKKFIERLGAGSVEGCLDIRPPLPDAVEGAAIRRIPREVSETFSANSWNDPAAEAAYRVEDMLIWGETSGADTLCWITAEADPDHWPVAVYNRGDLAWFVYDCGLSEFLLKVIRGDFDLCPLTDASLFGIESARFLTSTQEAEMMEQGINPWH